MDLVQFLFNFQGRARRLHYWLGRIGVAAVMWGLLGLTALLPGGGSDGQPAAPAAGLVMLVLFALWVWVDLAIAVKRCHDRGRSGWFLLIALIPLIGLLWLLIELGFLDGDYGSNRFGPSPKYGPDAAQAFA